MTTPKALMLVTVKLPDVGTTVRFPTPTPEVSMTGKTFEAVATLELVTTTELAPEAMADLPQTTLRVAAPGEALESPVVVRGLPCPVSSHLTVVLFCTERSLSPAVEYVALVLMTVPMLDAESTRLLPSVLGAPALALLH